MLIGAGGTEKVRTGYCFLEREMALRKWRKTVTVVFSDAFSLLLSFGMEKKVRRKTNSA
jgi:hypothetical protein